MGIGTGAATGAAAGSWGGPFGALAGAGIGAGASLLGGVLTNSANAKEAAKNRLFQHQEAENQMRFQESMSSSAYQRAMQDMRNAGLNPALAYQQGGASSPSGASGSGAQATMENVLGEGVTSALDALRLKKEIKGVDSQVALNEASEKAALASSAQSIATAKEAEKRMGVIEAQMPAIRAKAEYERKESNWNSKMVDYDAVQKRVDNTLGSINSAIQAVNPLKGIHINPNGATKVPGSWKWFPKSQIP